MRLDRSAPFSDSEGGNLSLHGVVANIESAVWKFSTLSSNSGADDYCIPPGSPRRSRPVRARRKFQRQPEVHRIGIMSLIHSGARAGFVFLVNTSLDAGYFSSG